MIGIAGDDLDAQIGERLRLVGIRLARDRACGEGAVLVGGNGARQAAALRACGSDDGNDLLV